MKRKLTNEDRRKLKYSTRTGYIFGVLILIPSISVYFISELNMVENIPDYLFPCGLLLCLLTIWLVNRKWWIDLRNNEKIVIQKKIVRKESKKEYAAGSSFGVSITGKDSPVYKSQNSYIDYSIIVDNTRYKIDKGIWDQVNENDKVEFHFAKKSNYLLSIQPVH